MITELGMLTMFVTGGIIAVDTAKTLLSPSDKSKGFEEVFEALNVINKDKKEQAKYLGLVQNNNYILLAFQLSPNITSEVFQKNKKEIAEKLGVKDNLEILTKKGHMYFKIRKPNPPAITYKCDTYYPENFIPVGFDEDFNVILWDMDIDGHMLIGGATNSGKSVCLHGIINYITRSDNYDLYLSDLKRVDYSVYGQNNLSSLVAYANSVAQTHKLIEAFEVEANIRWNQMIALNCVNYKDWKKKSPNTCPRRAILIIDEYPDLVPIKLRKDDVDYISLLVHLARKCRAVGMHIVISAQHPEAKVTPTALRNNFTARMAFRTADAIASRVIINRPDCYKLGVGQCYCRFKGQEVFARTALVTDNDILELVDQYSYTTLDDILDAEWRESETKEPTKMIGHIIDVEDIFTDDFLGSI